MRAKGRRAYNVTGFVFCQPLPLDKGNFTMLGASYSTVVAQTPETIFRLVSDPMRDSFWNPNAITMKNVSGGPPRVGAQYEGSYRRFGQVKLEITRFEPPHVVSIAGLGRQGSFTYTFTVERVPDGGGSSLHEDLQFAPRGWWRVARLFISRGLDADLRILVEAARRHLELQPVSGPL